MDGVEKRKEELFGKLKGAASRLRHKIHEESFLRKVLEEKRKECGLNARGPIRCALTASRKRFGSLMLKLYSRGDMRVDSRNGEIAEAGS
jgi:hypothetical protein